MPPTRTGARGAGGRRRGETGHAVVAARAHERTREDRAGRNVAEVGRRTHRRLRRDARRRVQWRRIRVDRCRGLRRGGRRNRLRWFRRQLRCFQHDRAELAGQRQHVGRHQRHDDQHDERHGMRGQGQWQGEARPRADLGRRIGYSSKQIARHVHSSSRVTSIGPLRALEGRLFGSDRSRQLYSFDTGGCEGFQRPRSTGSRSRLRARTGKHAAQAVIPFVAGVFVDLARGSLPVDRGGPRRGPDGGIVDGELVAQRVVATRVKRSVSADSRRTSRNRPPM